MTAEPADVVRLDERVREMDPRVRASAQEIAARLSIRRPRSDTAAHRGTGDLRRVPYLNGCDDIALDRTLEVMTGRPALADEDIVVRERVATQRSVVLAVDLSGSMRDDRIRTAAATVGALAGELARDDLAVLTFWSDAAWQCTSGPCCRRTSASTRSSPRRRAGSPTWRFHSSWR